MGRVSRIAAASLLVWMATSAGLPALAAAAATAGSIGQAAAPASGPRVAAAPAPIVVTVLGDAFARSAMAANGHLTRNADHSATLTGDRTTSAASTLTYLLPAGTVPLGDAIQSMAVRVCGSGSGDFWETYGPPGSSPIEYEQGAPSADGCWHFSGATGSDTTVLASIRLATTMTVQRVEYSLTFSTPTGSGGAAGGVSSVGTSTPTNSFPVGVAILVLAWFASVSLITSAVLWRRRRRTAAGSTVSAGGGETPVRAPMASARFRGTPRIVAVGVVGFLIGVAVIGVGAETIGSGQAGVASGTIVVGGPNCVATWTAPEAGNTTFSIRNSGQQPLEVELVGPDRHTVYAEIDVLAAGTTATLPANLAAGPYLWHCVLSDGSETYSAAEVVTGAGVIGAAGMVPVAASDLDASMLTYRDSVTAGLKVLATDTDALAAAVAAGQLTQAEGLWLTAHLDYVRLGAAYDTFGTFADQIDGRASGLPGGVNDPAFSGFLRLEYGLWHGQSPAVLASVAQNLDTAVHGLIVAFPSQQMDPSDLPIRTHEILENALQFELTGQTDMGSHTNLATVRANVDGTRTILAALAPLLQPREPALVASVTADLNGLATMLDGLRQPDGAWTPLASLTLSQREQLDGAIGALLEELAPIPDFLELPPITG